jgi:acetyltransferase-like isoleucine patch superfamily enzyme
MTGPAATTPAPPPVGVGDIVAHLRGLGMIEALIGAPGAAGPIGAVATDTQAVSGDLAWSRRPGAAAHFLGSLLICAPEAAEPDAQAADEPDAQAAGGLGARAAGGPGEQTPARVVIVCRRPRLAMALVLGRFFAHLAADRPAVYADAATALAVDDGRAWVRNVVAGHNVRIEPLATIGCSGMGYERDDRDRLVPFPQLGGVVLEDDVHVAAQAMIQRGAIGDTIARRGAKIGPHVNVGHNADVGENCLVAGHAQIGGGVRLGSRAVVWQSAAIANGVAVGDDAVIGMGAMIRADVGPGETWVGNPGRRLS